MMEQGHRILICDDEVRVRNSLRDLLQDHGYEVLSTSGGTECLHVMSTQHIDLVILDIVMPEVDGIETLRRIKKRYKETEVIMITGYADKEKAIGAFRLNAYDFVEKPFESKELLNTVANCLNQFDMKRDLERKTRALGESERKYRRIFNDSRDMIYISTRDGKLVDINPAGVELLGYGSKKELLNLESIGVAYVNRDDRKRFQETIARDGFVKDYAVELRKKDGTKISVLITSTARKDEKGNVLSYEGIIRDVTEQKKAQEDLLKEKEKFRILVENSPLGISLLGKDNRCKYINSKFIEMFGYTLEEVPTGREWFRKAFPDPEYRHELISIWKKDLEVARIGESRSRVFSVSCKDETEKVIRFRPVIMEGGDQLITYSDITARRHDAQKLRELNRAIEQSSEGIVTADLEGKILFVNRAWAWMHGYQVADLIGKPVAMLDSPANSKNLPAVWEETLKEGLWQGQLQRRKKDGSSFPAIMTSSLVKDDKDMPVGIIGTCKDISARRQAEEALRQSEERYRALFETAKDAIFLTDESGRFVDVNQAACDSLGYSKEELLQLSNRDIDADPRGYEAFQKLRDGLETKITFEVNQRRKDGTLLPVEITGGFFTAGGQRLFLAIARDRTASIYLEEQIRQSQKIEAVGNLAGGVAHDFNNILTAIIGNADLALMSIEKDHPPNRYLDEISRSARRAAHLTRQLLLFSRRQPMDMAPLHLTNLTQNLSKMLDRLIGEDISLDLDLEPETWSIEGDAGTIEQVIVNMVVNARDAMPEGGEINIRHRNVHVGQEYCASHTYARQGKFVRLSVRDNGTGMDQAVIDHIFEPFFTTKAVGKGTGLGLAVVYGIVKQHRGWIDVESSPGNGALFNIYLPAISAKPEEFHKDPVSLEALRGRGERILLVEDDNVLRGTSEKAIAEYGYTVFGAGNVREALHLFQQEGGKFDLVFCDVVLPDGTGPKLVEELLNIGPGTGVLFTSGHVGKKSAWSAIKESGYPYLQKPYSMSDLLIAVKDALKRR